MLPRFEIVARHRPVAVVGVPLVEASYVGTPGPQSSTGDIPLMAPYGAVEVTLAPGSAASGSTSLSIGGPDGTVLAATLAGRSVSLTVTSGGVTTRARSRRHHRTGTSPTRFALALTGTHLSALSEEDGSWVVRGRIDLARLDVPLDTRDVGWLAGLTAAWSSPGGVRAWSAGGFGQLGLRDIRLVTTADGSAYRTADGSVLFTATSAGPGFFDTAHTSMWIWDQQGGIRHRADLYFERADRPGGYGDHATHVVRDGERWLVATSTWSTLPGPRRERVGARVGVNLAETTADVTRGQHRLATRPLDLPTAGPSVGVWDPHLVRDEDGSWLVGYVSARRFFDFHPCVATGATLEDLTLRGAATDRTATEGTTLLRLDGRWRVLASDGRDNRRGVRGRFPVFDLDLREIATLDAPYPTNIPWPSVVPESGVGEQRWRLLTFNGAPAGGPLPGYGTHGEVVVMHQADRPGDQSRGG